MEIPSGFIDKAKFVRVIFTDVEREYDVLLRLMTLGFDRVWRHRVFAKMDFSKEMIVLDLACGTGLVTFELSRLVSPVGLVLGLDMSPAMLSVANRKKRDQRLGCDVGFVRAVGEFLPFRSDTIMYVTVGLALRNFADKISVFRETLRVLMRDGCFLSLDFVVPENVLFWRLYRFHIFHILPELGGLVSGYWKRTLTYLANTILKSSSPNEICQALSSVGFGGTFFERMTLGVVALVGGQKTASVT
jgi:demethylmenaquinone methyltransferase/2-methoxy-6-polyprenyl-1,4-benzoquinol methylase